MVLLSQKYTQMVQMRWCPRNTWSHKFLWFSCYQICLSNQIFCVCEQGKIVMNFAKNQSQNKRLISYQ